MSFYFTPINFLPLTDTGAKNWRILLNWEKYPKLCQLSAWKTGTICKCKLLIQISQTMQWHCSFMFLKWSFYFVRWNCHLLWYLSLQITSRFLSKMQPRQDYELFLSFFMTNSKCNFLSHARAVSYLPLIELNLRLFTFYKRSDTNLI